MGANGFNKSTGRGGLGFHENGSGAGRGSLAVATAAARLTPIASTERRGDGREVFDKKGAQVVDAANQAPAILATTWANACTERAGRVGSLMREGHRPTLRHQCGRDLGGNGWCSGCAMRGGGAEGFAHIGEWRTRHSTFILFTSIFCREKR